MAFQRTPLHDIVDPLGTLPEVKFLDLNNLDGTPLPFQGRVSLRISMSNLVILGNNNEILAGGKTTLDDDDNAFMFDWVGLAEGVERGKGHGMQMYLYAINHAHNQGLPFRSSSVYFSSSAKKVWERLVKLGVAEIEGDGFAPNYCDDEWTADIFARPKPKKCSTVALDNPLPTHQLFEHLC
jgi:hypothetical protein